MPLSMRKMFNVFKVLLYGSTVLAITLAILLLPTLFGALQPIFLSIILIPFSLIIFGIDTAWKKKLQSTQDELDRPAIIKIYTSTILVVLVFGLVNTLISQIDTFLYNNVSIYQEITHILQNY